MAGVEPLQRRCPRDGAGWIDEAEVRGLVLRTATPATQPARLLEDMDKIELELIGSILRDAMVWTANHATPQS